MAVESHDARPKGRAFAPRALGRLATLVTAGGVVAACAAEGDPEPWATAEYPLVTAECNVTVSGKSIDVESDYLPNVVNCENGDAAYEALKAQAVAARTYLYFKIETTGSISNSTSGQVYSCARSSSLNEMHKQAVRDTSGIILRYKDTTIASFYVRGGDPEPPACHGKNNHSTEQYVTYNEGKSGDGITQSTQGSVNPKNYRNRGTMSQLGATCLSDQGYTYDRILRFYYGDDIVIEQAQGPCVSPVDLPGAGGTNPGGTPAGDAGTGQDGSAGGPAPLNLSESDGCAIGRGAGTGSRTRWAAFALLAFAFAGVVRRRRAERSG